MTTFHWTTPLYAPDDLVIFLHGRNREGGEGVVQGVITTYANGRSQHCYRIKPYGKKNCVNVDQGMILRRGLRTAYGAVRYCPVRTVSDGRTDAQHARP